MDGEYLTDLRFADDVALTTTSVKDMEVQLKGLNSKSKKIGLKIHKGKNKVYDKLLFGRILHTLYCTFILPYINYGILIWGNTCKTYLDKLIKLQKWAIRTISKSHYRSHTRPLFAKYNILNVNDMYSLELGVFM